MAAVGSARRYLEYCGEVKARGRLVVATWVVLLALAIPAAASARVGAHRRHVQVIPPTAAGDLLFGTHGGYQVGVRLEEPDLAVLVVEKDSLAKLAVQRTSYGAHFRGSLAAGRVSADFGPVGSISVRFRPGGPVREGKLDKACEGKPWRREAGHWVGKVSLHGEGGYFAVSTAAANGLLQRTFRQRCHFKHDLRLPAPRSLRETIEPEVGFSFAAILLGTISSLEVENREGGRVVAMRAAHAAGTGPGAEVEAGAFEYQGRTPVGRFVQSLEGAARVVADDLAGRTSGDRQPEARHPVQRRSDLPRGLADRPPLDRHARGAVPRPDAAAHRAGLLQHALRGQPAGEAAGLRIPGTELAARRRTGLGGAAMRARWAAAAVALLVAGGLLVPAGAGAANTFSFGPGSVTFARVAATHGYRVNFSENDNGYFFVRVLGHGTTTDFATHMARARPGHLVADFGRRGRFDLRFVAVGKPSRLLTGPFCDGRPGSLQRGFLTGRARFRTEGGYAQVDLHRVQAVDESWSRLTCDLSKVPLPGHPKEERASFLAAATASGKSLHAAPKRTVHFHLTQFYRRAKPADQRVAFTAELKEHAGRISIDRKVLVKTDESSLVFPGVPSLPEELEVKPPAPFSGRGKFLRTHESTFDWSGDLAVAFPGLGPVHLTGPRFDIVMCASKACILRQSEATSAWARSSRAAVTSTPMPSR